MTREKMLKLREMQQTRADLRQYKNDLAYAKKNGLETDTLVEPEFDEKGYEVLAAEVKEELMGASTDDRTNADIAFMKLIGSYTVAATYPEKQKAMGSAVGSLGVDAAVGSLYAAAVEYLG